MTLGDPAACSVLLLVELALGNNLSAGLWRETGCVTDGSSCRDITTTCETTGTVLIPSLSSIEPGYRRE
jgi:hypothetical protein